MAGLTEAVCALQAGARRVLLVAFEGPVPAFHRPWLAEEAPPHALGLVLTAGDQWHCAGHVAPPRRPPAAAESGLLACPAARRADPDPR